MFKKIIIVFIVALIIIITGIIIHQVYGNQQEQKIQPIKIGVILPLTGKLAQYAQEAQQGIGLALEETDLPIQIYYEDHKYEPKEGIAAYQRLRLDDINLFITGSSNVSLALSPLINEDQSVQMAVFSSVSKYSSPDDFTFRVTPKAELENKELVNWAIDHDFKRCALIYSNDEWGQGHYETITAEFSNLGGEILSAESFLKGDTDFKSQLLKMKNSQPQAIIIIAVGKDGGLILKQAKELNIKAQFLGVRALEDSNLLEVAQGSAEGIVYPYSFDENSDQPKVKNFVDKYKAKYSQVPTAYVVEGYTALKLYLKALENCDQAVDSQCLKNDLLATQDYQSVLGKISFDVNGDILIPFFMKTIKDGQFVKYEQ